MSTEEPKPTRQEEAAKWFAAERAGMMLVEQRAEFDTWRADPRNQVALDAMRDLWDDLAVLKGARPSAQTKPRKRPRALATAAMFLIILGGLGTGWLAISGTPTIRTGVGQQQAQSLPDGSLISVNVASTVSYAINAERRSVKLDDGEVAFAVKPDPARPFIVSAGDFAIRAVGTEFNVRQRDGMIEVSVKEGKVDICRVGAADAGASVLVSLTAGQAMRFSALLRQGDFISEPTPTPVDQVAEWRMRVVTYEDVPVRDIVADLNRYFEQKLKVADPALLNRRVTVRLKVDERGSAVATLASLLDAKILNLETGGSLAPK